MSLFKYRTHLIMVGGITAICGIILTGNIVSLPLIIFGCYWSGLGMGLSYKEDNEARSRT